MADSAKVERMEAAAQRKSACMGSAVAWRVARSARLDKTRALVYEADGASAQGVCKTLKEGAFAQHGQERGATADLTEAGDECQLC